LSDVRVCRVCEARVTLLVGLHAQKAYLRDVSGATLTEKVRNFDQTLPGRAPLPHLAWRSTGWMRRNPWFEADPLPALRRAVAAALD
jgi:uracil-DNA glycosylase